MKWVLIDLLYKIAEDRNPAYRRCRKQYPRQGKTNGDYFPDSIYNVTFSKIELLKYGDVPLISICLSLSLFHSHEQPGIVYGSEGVLSPVLRRFARSRFGV